MENPQPNDSEDNLSSEDEVSPYFQRPQPAIPMAKGKKDQKNLTIFIHHNNAILQRRNASSVQRVDTNVLEHIRSQKSVATARGIVGSATLKKKEKGKGNLSLQKKNVSNVDDVKASAMGYTHSPKHVAHADLQRGGHAPLKPRK